MYPNSEENNQHKYTFDQSHADNDQAKIDLPFPMTFGEESYSNEISRSYVKILSSLESASHERLLSHPLSARKYIGIAQELKKESGLVDINLDAKIIIEKALISLFEGDLQSTWDDINSYMWIISEESRVEPYLMSAIHAIEAVCLQNQGLHYYSEMAVDRSKSELKIASAKDSDFNNYHPLILLCHARHLDPQRCSKKYISRLIDTRDFISQLEIDNFPDKHLYTAFVNTVICKAHLRNGNIIVAQEYIDLADDNSVKDESNLRFAINIIKSRTYLKQNEIDLAYDEFAKAKLNLPKIKELSPRELKEFVEGIFDIYYACQEYSQVVDSIEIAKKKSKETHGIKLELSSYQNAKLAYALNSCEHNIQALCLYQETADKHKQEKIQDPELLYTIHHQAFKCAFELGYKPAILAHSQFALEQAKKFTDLNINSLVLSLYSVSAAYFVNSQIDKSLNYLRMAFGVLPEDESCIETEADMCNLKAIIAIDLGCYDAAIENLQRTLHIKNSVNGMSNQTTSGILTNLAEAYLKNKQYAECYSTLGVISDFIEDNPDFGLSNRAVIAYQGLIFLETSEATNLAEEYLERARITYYELNSPNDIQIAEINKWIGDLSFRKNDRETAFRHYFESERIYQHNNVISTDRAIVNYRLISLCLDAEGQDAAIGQQEEYLDLRKTLDDLREKYFPHS